MKRGLKITLLAIVALVILIILALASVLGTQAGSRWALARVPGLTLDNFEAVSYTHLTLPTIYSV